MTTELPVACSLDAPELPERLRAIGELGADALLDHRLDGTRAELRFAAHPGVRARVAAIVAAESRCCAFLTMRVSEEPDAVVLTVAAPEDAEAVLAELVDAFAGGCTAP